MNQLSKRPSLQHKTSMRSNAEKQLKKKLPQKQKMIIKHPWVSNREEPALKRKFQKKDQILFSFDVNKFPLMIKHKSQRRFRSGKRVKGKQSQIEKAFIFHKKSFISLDQCIMSLKLLGCVSQEEGEIAKIKVLMK